MVKLLDDLKNWDQEKEDNWNKRIADREKKIAAIKAERAAKNKDRDKRKAEREARLLAAQ